MPQNSEANLIKEIRNGRMKITADKTKATLLIQADHHLVRFNGLMEVLTFIEAIKQIEKWMECND